jgi:TolA-binding protein
MLPRMKFAVVRGATLIALLSSFSLAVGRAQGLQVDVEEFKRLAGEVADLRDANAAHIRRISQMQKEIDALREALRESQERATAKMGDFATREDLKKIAEKIQEVDQRRESDRKLILEEFEKLGKTLAQAPVVEKPERKTSRKKEKEPEKESNNDAPAQPIEGTFYPYKVKKGERLADIIKAYNTALQKEGRPSISLESVKRANPKVNINRIYEGQEILLPVPEKKK